jgi:hypothetical protein
MVVSGRRRCNGDLEQYSFILKEEKLFSTKRMKVMLVAAVAAMALTAVTAGTASAAVVAAKFSPASEFYIKATSAVTIKKNGGSAKSCTMADIRATPAGSYGEFLGANVVGFGETKFTCSGFSPLVMRFMGQAKYDNVSGAYWLQVSDGPSQTLSSPWGGYLQNSSGLDKWSWVNGSGSTPSTLTLNDVRVGYLASTGENITISGTFKATTLSGGLITLAP